MTAANEEIFVEDWKSNPMRQPHISKVVSTFALEEANR